MNENMNVKLFEKMPDGEIREMEDRTFTANMIAALEHVNYLIIGGREYETVEGRLNVDEERLELLLVPVLSE